MLTSSAVGICRLCQESVPDFEVFRAGQGHTLTIFFHREAQERNASLPRYFGDIFVVKELGKKEVDVLWSDFPRACFEWSASPLRFASL